MKMYGKVISTIYPEISVQRFKILEYMQDDRKFRRQMIACYFMDKYKLDMLQAIFLHYLAYKYEPDFERGLTAVDILGKLHKYDRPTA